MGVEGSPPGPTWRIRPGDRVLVRRSVKPRERADIVLAPGNRRSSQDTVTLGTLTVAGAAVADQPALPALPRSRDLRAATAAVRRQLTSAMGMGGGITGMYFTIAGRPFDPIRVVSPAARCSTATSTSTSTTTTTPA